LGFFQVTATWKGKVSGDQIYFKTIAPSGVIKQAIARRKPDSQSGQKTDLSGRWIALSNGVRIELTFMVNGDSLAGTVFNSQDGEGEIRDGKIEKSKVTFTVVHKGHEDSSIQWQGKRKNDRLEFKCQKKGNPPLEIAASRIVSNISTDSTAANLSGQWLSVIPGGLKFLMNINVEGSAFTGTMATSADGETEIKGGKIEGDGISFYVMRKEFDMPDDVKIEWKGIVFGDEIRFVCIRPRSGPVYLTLTKSHSKQPLKL
jgi:hypothetical protein